MENQSFQVQSPPCKPREQQQATQVGNHSGQFLASNPFHALLESNGDGDDCGSTSAEDGTPEKNEECGAKGNWTLPAELRSRSVSAKDGTPEKKECDAKGHWTLAAELRSRGASAKDGTLEKSEECVAKRDGTLPAELRSQERHAKSVGKCKDLQSLRSSNCIGDYIDEAVKKKVRIDEAAEYGDSAAVTKLEGDPLRSRNAGRWGGEHHNPAGGVRLAPSEGRRHDQSGHPTVDLRGGKVRGETKAETCVAEELECDANAVNGQIFFLGGVQR